MHITFKRKKQNYPKEKTCVNYTVSQLTAHLRQ